MNIEDNQLLRGTEVLGLWGIRWSKLYEMVRQNEFPGAASIARRAVG